MIVLKKYGGSSLSSIAKIKMVANNIEKAYKNSDKIAVVVSAIAGDTDKLIQLGKLINEEYTSINIKREMDTLVSTGEQVSASLLAMALNQRNIPAKSYVGWQLGILTNDDFQNANVKNIKNIYAIKQEIAAGIVPVIAGFQGVSEQGDITTLGRNTSDFSAVLIAQYLQADECQIFTDVDGIYVTDPRIYPCVQKYNELPLNSAWRLAKAGAKVIHLKALEILYDKYLPTKVLSATEQSSGTLITNTKNPSSAPIGFNIVEIDAGKTAINLACELNDSILNDFLRIMQRFPVINLEETEYGYSLTINRAHTKLVAQDVLKMVTTYN